MINWITDRLPTVSDLVGVEREVWHYCTDQGFASRCHWSDIERLGEPWQPITMPAPYLKSKRWTVCKDSNGWNIYDGDTTRYFLPTDCSDAAAQRICDIYNEVLP
jgi:hypothetical protein